MTQQRSSPADLAVRPRPGPAAMWCYGLALTLFVSSWHLRNSVLMAWSPVEPVWVGAVAVGACVVHRLGHDLRLPFSVAGPVWAFVLATLPGVFLSGDGVYTPTKMWLFYAMVVPLLCGALVLLDDPRARWRWACAQVVMAGVLVVAILGFNDLSAIAEPGRLSLASVDTISTARIVGAGVVVLLAVAVGSERPRWSAAVAALLGLGVMVQVGSRGPLLSALVTVVVVVVVSRGTKGSRSRAALLTASVLGLLYAYAVTSGSLGAQRVLGVLDSPFDDDARRALVDEGLRAAVASPWGLGWGAFPGLSEVGTRLQNSEGNAYPHNVFVELFVEGGLLALLAFVVLVVLALLRLRGRSVDPRELAVLAVTVYWLLAAQTSSDINGNRAMWVGIAAGLAAVNGGSIVRQNRSKREIRRFMAESPADEEESP